MTRPDIEREACCRDREYGWLLDDVAVLGLHGGLIPATLIDQLPPARALLHVRLALQGYARLETGDLVDLVDAAHLAIGNRDAAAPGWWSRFLAAKHLSEPVTIPVTV